MKFDHIGVFVKNLEDGRKNFSSLLQITNTSEEYNDEKLKVSVQFLYDKNDICYEIVAPYKPGNPVDAVLSSGKNILNHIAYRVDELDLSLSTWRNKGCFPLSEATPAIAFQGAKVIFLLTPLGIIIELIEDNLLITNK